LQVQSLGVATPRLDPRDRTACTITTSTHSHGAPYRDYCHETKNVS